MRSTAVALALAGWAGSAFVLVLGIYADFGLRCDESCYGSGWRHTPDAWQWKAYGVLAIGVFVAGTVFVRAVARLRLGLAVTAVAAALAGACVFFGGLSGDGVRLDHLSGTEQFLACAAVLGPVTAIVLVVDQRKAAKSGDFAQASLAEWDDAP